VGKAPALAVKVEEVKPADTVTEAGTVSTEAAVLERETAVPPDGAPLEMVTVHVVLPFAAKTFAAHSREDSVIGATSEILDVAELPFSVAVRVAV
jgi:hypothetical protein